MYSREKEHTVSEREWQPRAGVKYYNDVALKTGRGSLLNNGQNRFCAAMLTNGFPGTHRLNSADSYSRVFEQPDYKAHSTKLLLLARENGLANPRIGIIVSTKNVGKATARNRIKRILRECFRLNQHQLSALDIVILAKKSAASHDNRTLNNQCQQLFSKLCAAHPQR